MGATCLIWYNKASDMSDWIWDVIAAHWSMFTMSQDEEGITVTGGDGAMFLGNNR